jgi:SAM-dependent methyltransferase
MLRPETLRRFFENLREAGYTWQAQTPDRLLSFRRAPGPFSPLVRWLGLGLVVSEESLIEDGLKVNVLKSLRDEGFFQHEKPSEMAVSGLGEHYIIHDHWPPSDKLVGGYVHYAAESEWLARACTRDLEAFLGRRVLDLGCSSGALAFEIGAVAEQVLGLDISERAITWGRVSAEALGLPNVRFEQVAVGSPQAEALVSQTKWDVVISNPPMVIPSKDGALPHRDGGALGIELPLMFLEFAHRHLRTGGEVLMLATNPLVHGRGAFFEKFDRKKWDVLEKRCVHPQFNQSVARKQNYADQGIQNVELYFLHLRAI